MSRYTVNVTINATLTVDAVSHADAERKANARVLNNDLGAYEIVSCEAFDLLVGMEGDGLTVQR